MKINITRTVLNITTFCNLKCKNCLAFIPYYEKKQNIAAAEAKIIIKKYFEVVDTVEHFTVTGGEPLLNKDVYEILCEVFRYKNQIVGSVDFVTNGTLMIPDNILDLFESHKQYAKIVLSNYGDELSTDIDKIEEKLRERDINYRISKFYGDDLYYNGWIDFSDHSLKWKTVEERDKNASKCIHHCGRYFIIYDGEIHSCSRSYWRIRNHIIPKIEGEYVPLVDEKYTLEYKREMLLEMVNKKSTTSCAHCVGLCNDVPRVRPAVQLD